MSSGGEFGTPEADGRVADEREGRSRKSIRVLPSSAVGGADWRVRLVWQAPGVEVDGLTDGVCALGEDGLYVGRSGFCQIRTRTIIGGRKCARIELRDGVARVQHMGHVYPVQVDQTMLTDGSCPLGVGQVVRFFQSDDMPAFELRLERGPAPAPIPRQRPAPRQQPAPSRAPARVSQASQPSYGFKLHLRIQDVHPDVFAGGGPAAGRTFPLSAGIGNDYDRCGVLVPPTANGSLGRRVYRIEQRQKEQLLLHCEPPDGSARIAGAVVRSFPCIIRLNQPIELLFENSTEAAVTVVATESDELKQARTQARSEKDQLVEKLRADLDELRVGPPVGIQCGWQYSDEGRLEYQLVVYVSRPSFQHGALSAVTLCTSYRVKPWEPRETPTEAVLAEAGRALAEAYGALHSEVPPKPPPQFATPMGDSIPRPTQTWTALETRRVLPHGEPQQRQLSLVALSPRQAAQAHVDEVFASADRGAALEVSVRFLEDPEGNRYLRHSLGSEDSKQLARTLQLLHEGGAPPAGLRATCRFVCPSLHASCWLALISQACGLGPQELDRRPRKIDPETMSDADFDAWVEVQAPESPPGASHAAALLRWGTVVGPRKVVPLSPDVSLTVQRVTCPRGPRGWLAAVWSETRPYLISESYRSSHTGNSGETHSHSAEVLPKEVFGLPDDVNVNDLRLDAQQHAAARWGFSGETPSTRVSESGSVELQLVHESLTGRITTRVTSDTSS